MPRDWKGILRTWAWFKVEVCTHALPLLPASVLETLSVELVFVRVSLFGIERRSGLLALKGGCCLIFTRSLLFFKVNLTNENQSFHCISLHTAQAAFVTSNLGFIDLKKKKPNFSIQRLVCWIFPNHPTSAHWRLLKTDLWPADCIQLTDSFLSDVSNPGTRLWTWAYKITLHRRRPHMNLHEFSPCIKYSKNKIFGGSALKSELFN